MTPTENEIHEDEEQRGLLLHDNILETIGGDFNAKQNISPLKGASGAILFDL